MLLRDADHIARLKSLKSKVRNKIRRLVKRPLAVPSPRSLVSRLRQTSFEKFQSPKTIIRLTEGSKKKQSRQTKRFGVTTAQDLEGPKDKTTKKITTNIKSQPSTWPGSSTESRGTRSRAFSTTSASEMGGSASSDLLSGSSGTWEIASSLPRSPLSTDDAFKSSPTQGGAPSLDSFSPLLSIEESDNSGRSSRPGFVSLPSAGRTGTASPGPTSRACWGQKWLFRNQRL